MDAPLYNFLTDFKIQQQDRFSNKRTSVTTTASLPIMSGLLKKLVFSSVLEEDLVQPVLSLISQILLKSIPSSMTFHLPDLSLSIESIPPILILTSQPRRGDGFSITWRRDGASTMWLVSEPT